MQVPANLPNIISISRIVLTPVALWRMILGDYTSAFWIFLVAGATDALDGILAKQFNAQSELGTYLDPLADKALLVSIFIMLGLQGFLPPWLVILIVFRDVILVGGVILILVMGGEDYKVHPALISKANTAFQISLAGIVLFGAAYGDLDMGFMDGALLDALIYLTAATTFLSGAFYLLRWIGGGQGEEI